MNLLFTLIAMIAVLCLSGVGFASAGRSQAEECAADGGPLTGMLPRQEEIVGRLTANQRPDAGTNGWELVRQGRTITLDVTNVQARADRLRGERVRIEGHFVFAGFGRAFIVLQIRRA